MRIGKVFVNDNLAGTIKEDENGYSFKYELEYCLKYKNHPVSLTLPVREEPYTSNVLFPFFDGLIPEGYLLELAFRRFNLTRNDRMYLLLKTCRNPIGNVSIEEIQND